MAKDQYKYFRIEARELLEGLNAAVLELEGGECGKGLVGRLLRFAHTLKGASRVVKQSGIAELAHSIEDAFIPYREGQGPIPQAQTNHVLGMLDMIANKVAYLDLPRAEPTGETQRAITAESFETVRVEMEEMDALLNGVTEASVRLTALRREVETVERARRLAGDLLGNAALRLELEARETGWNATSAKARGTAEELRNHLQRLERNFAAGIDEVETEFAQVRDVTNRLRLLPVATVFASLERVVRDAAQSLHKEVLFESVGGAIRLDAHVLAALRDALPHVVRNAVAHGIESQPERAATGKLLQGRVALRVERRGSRVVFTCTDDGRGIDVEAVRRAAVRKGVVAASDAVTLGMEEAVQIILQGGVSTMGAVDELSGRGIGLDVVREAAARLKGEVRVRSVAGKGTSLEICVPVSISSLTALELDSDGSVVALPLDAIRRTLRVADHDIARSADRDSIVYEGKVIPFLALSSALRKTTAADSKRRFWSTVILEASSGLAAIGVDRLLGTTIVVVKSLPSLTKAETVVAGASLDSLGNPQLVLDPEGLVATAHLGRAAALEPLCTKRVAVLVVDDSLTTRMLEQSILESAGYEVDVATCGEEALEKARAKQFGLFLVDVEMPGMDGFEFVSRTQADAALRTVPAILVTSRSAIEDRRHGERVGARGYIIKSEFDQGNLLRMISELTE
ncbi:MAG: CheA signal transduction histidine kinase [Gammaproteobacteria bacterium]|nr:CheA signal transduction histidine kinase [Gammaproteobacteria bacterium]